MKETSKEERSLENGRK